MSSAFRQQIEDMEPRRFARAAKRAAILAKQLAEKSGKEISAQTRYLVETAEDQIAADRAQEREAPKS